jgi:hypothetical protein
MTAGCRRYTNRPHQFLLKHHTDCCSRKPNFLRLGIARLATIPQGRSILQISYSLDGCRVS